MAFNKIKTLFTFLKTIGKWRFFLIILLLILVIGTIFSLITHLTLIQDDINTRPRVAVVKPADSIMGTSFQQGVAIYLDTINRKGGYQGRQVEALILNESKNIAETIIADERVIAVLGHFNSDILQKSAPVYARKHLPVVSPLFLSTPLAGVTTLGLDCEKQARFIANYARNIQQQRLMYVVREQGAEFDPLVEPFLDVYKNFETPVKQIWTITNDANVEVQLQQVLADIKNIDIGGVYIATNPKLAASLTKGIHDLGNALELYGPAQLATNAFSSEISQLFPQDADAIMHGILTVTPVLFDTANEQAQYFQSHYQQKFKQSPDWIAVYAFDAAQIALSAKSGVDSLQGIIGDLNFIENHAQIPIQIGIYNGDKLISAPVQLLPIANGAGFNYIEALRQGRALYVNDRFMFKTNVVYIGITLNEISELDLQKETALLDMSIWFRYKGNFSPEDLQIANAVEPVKLNTPEESKDSESGQYRRYRIKQKFTLNFTKAKRAYGEHIAGISLRHRLLNRNNLMYVVDILGMPTGNDLITNLHQRRVVKASTGWEADTAWESQEIENDLSEGAPQYVGMTGEQPIFSKIAFGVLLKPATLNARDIIPTEYFIYIAIFGLLGTGFSSALDAFKYGRFWAMQSWLLRLIFWPLLLLSVGNLSLDWAFSNLAPATTRIFVVVYESLWWLMGAWLIDVGIRRFIWQPISVRTTRQVPNVIKLLGSLLIFFMAFSMILSVVFNQSLTSLLATSGVLAMVIGLALKDIIANVFSGIILNIERPFKVGDYIKVNNVIGLVKDITWRTTRIESNDGQMVSLANAKVSEAFMENYSLIPYGLATEIMVYTKPNVDTTLVLKIISEAVAQSNNIICKDDVTVYCPKIRYKGIINVGDSWVSCFSANFRINNFFKRGSTQQELWLSIQQKFVAHNISLVPVDDTINTPKAADSISLSK